MAQGGTLFRNRLMPVGAALQGPIPVVPGGFGFGMETRAAYGGETNPAILTVTNLNDSGSGSLRAALTASGPRVVIFEISGTIVLQSDITITEPYLTVAGQTAPSPGITLRGDLNASVSAGGINIHTHDVLVQHLRVRPGDGGPVLVPTSAHNAVGVYYASAYNVVLDHVSASWAGGKNFQTAFMASPANITLWRCISSEALWWARNIINNEGNDVNALGMHLGGSDQPGGDSRQSVFGSLLAHNAMRNPELEMGSHTHWINNVLYDWGTDFAGYGYPWGTFVYGSGNNAESWRVDVIGNKYIAGAGPHPMTPLYAIGAWAGSNASEIYISDNLLDQTLETIQEFHNNLGFDPRVGTPPVSLSGITVLPSSQVQAFVLANAGARPADRDAVDTRIVNEVTNRTGTVIRSQDDVGGWPTLAENTWSLSPPVDPHQVQPSGYTALEEWLHSYAADVEG